MAKSSTFYVWVFMQLVFMFSTAVYQEFAKNSCPCSDDNWCSQILATDRHEIVGYGVNLTYYKDFNWTKLTTLVVYESYLKEIGIEIVCHAHKHNTRVVIATVISGDQLRNSTQRNLVVNYYLKIAEDYHLDGANIDVEIEISDPILSNDLTAYARELKHAFSTVFPTSIVIIDAFWSTFGGHNTTELAKICDFIFIMAYDEQSNMPYPCVARANSAFNVTMVGLIQFLKLGVPSKKLVLGLPWYGYYYTCLKLTGDDLCYLPENGCTDAVGSEINYSTVMDLLSMSKGGRHWNTSFESPYFNLKTNATAPPNQIWYDDPESLKLKYDLMIKYHLRGVGIWHVDSLNYTIPNLPETIQMWKALPDLK